jgi:hypothetical protein
MAEVPIKVAPTVYDILEATIKAAIQFTEAGAGHIFLIRRTENQLLVSHQCLLTERGDIIRQYQEDRPFIYGPCQRSIEDGRMYYVHDASSNPLHQALLANLGRIVQKAQRESLKHQYLEEYLDFLRRARSYVSVPIKGLNTEPIGALALYSYTNEDHFGPTKKRIIEEYMDNFASSLIIALIDDASRENQRMKELLESYGERLAWDTGITPGSVFDGREHADFRGVGPALEHILRRANGKVYKALQLLKMPKRTFYNRVKKLGIEVQHFRRQKPVPSPPAR